jgi:hypothetical protein
MGKSQTVKHLNAENQIAQTDFQGNRNTHQGVNGDVFLSALNVADVIVVEVGFFGQFLLAPFHRPAVRSDVFTQNLSVFWDFHNTKGNPKPHIRTTVYALYFVLAFFPRFADCLAT